MSDIQFKNPSFLDNQNYSVSISKEKSISSTGKPEKKYVMTIKHEVSQEHPDKIETNSPTTPLKITVNGNRSESSAKAEFRFTLNQLNKAAGECFENLFDPNKTSEITDNLRGQTNLTSTETKEGAIKAVTIGSQTTFNKIINGISKLFSSAFKNHNTLEKKTSTPTSENKAPINSLQAELLTKTQQKEKAQTQKESTKLEREATDSLIADKQSSEEPLIELHLDSHDNLLAESSNNEIVKNEPSLAASRPQSQTTQEEEKKVLSSDPELDNIKDILNQAGNSKRIELNEHKTLSVTELNTLEKLTNTGLETKALTHILKILINKSAEGKVDEVLPLHKKLSDSDDYKQKIKNHPSLAALDKSFKHIANLQISVKSASATSETLTSEFKGLREALRDFPGLLNSPSLDKFLLPLSKTLVEKRLDLEKLENSLPQNYLNTIKSEGNEKLKETLLFGHRNNDETRNIIDDLKKTISNNTKEENKNILKFLQNYLELGYSIPIDPIEQQNTLNTLIDISNSEAIKNSLPQEALLLKETVTKLKKNLDNPISQEQRIDLKEKQDLQSYSVNNLPEISPFNITKQSASEIFQNLTALTEQKFLKIDIRELDRQGWAKNRKFSPTIIDYTNFSTGVSNWVTYQLLLSGGSIASEKKQEMIGLNTKKMLEVAELALGKGGRTDIGLAIAIVGGLSNSAIHRLIKEDSIAGKKLTSHDREIISEVLLLTKQGYAHQRVVTNQAILNGEHTIPYVGTTQQDITFLTEGNQSKLNDGNVNTKTINDMAIYKKNILKMQESIKESNDPYANENKNLKPLLQSIETIQKTLSDVTKTNDLFYKLSQSIKE